MVEVASMGRQNIKLLSTLFIFVVLFLHHTSYSVAPFRTYDVVNVFLVYFSVGGFLFLSGYKLAKNKGVESFSVFWKNRLIRIYPLYAIAVFVFSIALYWGKTNLLVLIIHLLGLQMVFPGLFGQNFLTLYFIGILLVFYLFFSLTKKYQKDPRSFTVLSVAVFCIALLVKYTLSGNITVFSSPLFIYFPVFTAGMLLADSEERVAGFMHRHMIAIFFWFFFLIPAMLVSIRYFAAEENAFVLLSAVVIGSVLIPLHTILVLFGRHWRRVPSVVSAVSYASFAMYLFHRPIWGLMQAVYPDRTLLQWAYIVGVGVPLIIGVSYVLQYSYDTIRRAWRR